MGTKPHKGLLRGYYLYNSKHSIKIKGCYPQAQFVDYQAMPPEQKQQPNQNPPATPKIAIRTMKTDMDEYLKTARPSLGSMIAQTSAGLASDEERETNKLPAIIIFSVIGVAVLGGGAFFVSQFLKGGLSAGGGGQDANPPAQKISPPAPFFATETSRTITAKTNDRPGFVRLMADSMAEKEREGTVKRIVIKVQDGPQERFATISDFFDFWRIAPPQSFTDSRDAPLMVFIYYGRGGSRLGFAARARSPDRTLADMLAWEPGLLTAFTPLFFDEKTDATFAPFEDRTYRNIDWRYLKLSQDKDLGIAHAIFPASNLLIAAMSKEAMETVMNRLFDAR